ncbi:hypothetical protein [Streptacidiphilus rugosus]|uniref:hypothetical protein n=1 Tax=Streptacidiphilus rugosus TaxID=405783 RepID=UPI00056759D4|nr:hypothetical protein [Streptacidiphilus rugosus]
MTITMTILLTPLFVLLMWLAAESWAHGTHRQPPAAVADSRTLEPAIPAPAQALSGTSVRDGG